MISLRTEQRTGRQRDPVGLVSSVLPAEHALQQRSLIPERPSYRRRSLIPGDSSAEIRPGPRCFSELQGVWGPSWGLIAPIRPQTHRHKKAGSPCR
jgi:hypothetical protein